MNSPNMHESNRVGETARREFDAVVVALPAFRAARLIEGFAARAAVALDGIEYASTAIVVSGHKLADIRHPLDAFGLVVPAIEKRVLRQMSRRRI